MVVGLLSNWGDMPLITHTLFQFDFSDTPFDTPF